MYTAEILREERDGILSITFNRPEKLNAITPAMLQALQTAVDDLRDNDNLRVLLIKSTGRYFSAGMDISGGMAPSGGSGVEFRRWYRRSLHVLFDEFEAVEKPIVMAIHAPCLGGALELALACDFRLAAEGASFGLPETKLGTIPGSGGTSRLTRIAGPAWAKWLIMAAQNIDAQRALQIGLVQAVYGAEEFEQRALEFAQQLAGLPREVMGMAKVAIETVCDLDRASARNIERMANSWLTMAEEHKTLMEQFSNRKKK